MTRLANMGSALAAWRLFWLLAFALSAAIGLKLLLADLHSARGIESIILFTVRCSLPFFLIAFVASSLRILCPNKFTRWLLANRRYFGLAFAFGMAWHLTFVAYSVFLFGNNLNRTVLTLDVIGLVFLVLLTFTSFPLIARHVKPHHWRRLHKVGVYVIWLLATYIYQAGARGDRDVVHFSFLGILALALTLRTAAWAKSTFGRMSATGSIATRAADRH